MNIKAVVFDLDGTLLDTLHDLASSCNRALALLGRPPRAEDEIRSFIGNGARMLCARLLGPNASEQAVDDCLTLFQADYNLHMNDSTAPYPGILEMLNTLAAHNIGCAVVSNKYDAATRAICRRHFGDALSVVIGEGNGISKKPCPDGVLKALTLLGCPPENAVYVGDSDTDVETAHNAGLFCIGVTWGFRSRQVLEMADAESIVDDPAELLDVVLS